MLFRSSPPDPKHTEEVLLCFGWSRQFVELLRELEVSSRQYRLQELVQVVSIWVIFSHQETTLSDALLQETNPVDPVQHAWKFLWVSHGVVLCNQLVESCTNQFLHHVGSQVCSRCIIGILDVLLVSQLHSVLEGLTCGRVDRTSHLLDQEPTLSLPLLLEGDSFLLKLLFVLLDLLEKLIFFLLEFRLLLLSCPLSSRLQLSCIIIFLCIRQLTNHLHESVFCSPDFLS